MTEKIGILALGHGSRHPHNTTCSYNSPINGHNKYSYLMNKYFDN